MSMKKQYLKGKKMCKVTFRVPGKASMGAKTVNLAGDFNHWSVTDSPMKKLKNGDFTLTLNLKTGKEYQFRYLMDEKVWENDWEADKYVRSEYGNCENSVVVV
ncbi:isoamylase early set domain-containing protein [Desulfosudis oleivorans]|uniref:Glycoside hydrolase, family 13-like protein n=1 Tax=Desulfosudis oleivorans (strain DSM 6200 / JCM 39069 / Hxd3) TaxID=96561 RepID=A8ZVV1_DESOH|nr:isoamylase early set domain-containing protein [Desulfosudis oleivorans]ABW66660.1 glycoside hydrolase, family 13-like protein [Desulfosudis oleivorans Hxd3]